MIDLHQEGRPTLAAEFAVTEIRRFLVADLVLARGPPKIFHWNAGEDHCRRSAAELAGPAMAPSSVERITCQFVPNGAAHASSGPPRH
jgi:hypothetical protein